MTANPPDTSWTARREAMGKSIAQVSAELRIAPRYLAGIEDGNFTGFPEHVFSTGFIRTYARYLSLDAGPVLAAYERSIGRPDDNETTAQLRFGWVERERERGSRRTAYIVAAGCVLLVGVILAWVSLHTENRPLPPPPVPAALPAPPAVENAAKGNDNTAVDHPAGADNAATPVVLQQPVPPGPAVQSPSVAAVGDAGPLMGPFQLFLEASDQAWVMYSFDGGDPMDVTLYAGDKISIHAKKRITLKLGNAGGVTGTLNGRRLPPFGERGQVRKFTFGSQ